MTCAILHRQESFNLFKNNAIDHTLCNAYQTLANYLPPANKPKTLTYQNLEWLWKRSRNTVKEWLDKLQELKLIVVQKVKKNKKLFLTIVAYKDKSKPLYLPGPSQTTARPKPVSLPVIEVVKPEEPLETPDFLDCFAEDKPEDDFRLIFSNYVPHSNLDQNSFDKEWHDALNSCYGTKHQNKKQKDNSHFDSKKESRQNQKQESDNAEPVQNAKKEHQQEISPSTHSLNKLTVRNAKNSPESLVSQGQSEKAQNPLQSSIQRRRKEEEDQVILYVEKNSQPVFSFSSSSGDKNVKESKQSIEPNNVATLQRQPGLQQVSHEEAKSILQKTIAMLSSGRGHKPGRKVEQNEFSDEQIGAARLEMLKDPDIGRFGKPDKDDVIWWLRQKKVRGEKC